MEQNRNQKLWSESISRLKVILIETIFPDLFRIPDFSGITEISPGFFKVFSTSLFTDCPEWGIWPILENRLLKYCLKKGDWDTGSFSCHQWLQQSHPPHERFRFCRGSCLLWWCGRWKWRRCGGCAAFFSCHGFFSDFTLSGCGDSFFFNTYSYAFSFG